MRTREQLEKDKQEVEKLINDARNSMNDADRIASQYGLGVTYARAYNEFVVTDWQSSDVCRQDPSVWESSTVEHYIDDGVSREIVAESIRSQELSEERLRRISEIPGEKE